MSAVRASGHPIGEAIAVRIQETLAMEAVLDLRIEVHDLGLQSLSVDMSPQGILSFHDRLLVAIGGRNGVGLKQLRGERTPTKCSESLRKTGVAHAVCNQVGDPRDIRRRRF